MIIGDIVVVKDQPKYQYPIEGGVLVSIEGIAALVNDGINMEAYLLENLCKFGDKDNTLVGQHLFVKKTIMEHPNVQT